jgi:methylated-DNA-[protein]-cysteine S-methyltransferase
MGHTSTRKAGGPRRRVPSVPAGIMLPEEFSDEAVTYYTLLKGTAIGNLLFTANDTDLTGLYCVEKRGPLRIEKEWIHKPGQRVLAVKQVKEFLAGKRKVFSVPVHFDGTEFQEKIWTHTMRIPYGETLSYSELAARAGNPRAIRAAGSALREVPICLIIPAQRVIAKGGGAGGYSGDWNRKAYLLELEQAVMAGKTKSKADDRRQIAV